MALAPGRRLGAYEIIAAIGAGGMGEVYRARDRKLDRDVAIKILPESLASDLDRIVRFEREAKTLATLNHPNIAAIYGLDESNGLRALVLELVEGPTLADRIAKGPIPLEEALPIAKQIADALEAAHEHGIIHRDLKPANIKVRDDGTVKVLDFGLAKALEPAAAVSSSVSMSPTITTPAMTQMGMLLGTAAYMSPEQAKGRPADKRSDVWAFGCVLYEMLAGKRAFDGEDVSDTLAAVLRGEPDWSALPAITPASFHKLLRRCLEKDRTRRLDSAATVRLEIENALTAPSAEPARVPRRFMPLAIASVLGTALVVALGTWMVMRPARPVPGRVDRFLIPTPAEAPIFNATSPGLAISPDGSRVVYRTTRGQNTQTSGVLYLRDRGQLEPTLLRGTEGAAGPVFSPDGEWIAFWSGTDNTLKRVSVLGGPPQTICAHDGSPPRGASWGPDDTIVFATLNSKGLRRVAAAGGEPQVLTKVEGTAGEEDALPEVLPGGRAVLFTAWASTPERSRIKVVSLSDGHVSTLVSGGTQPRFSPTGHLLFAVGGTLRAVRFDPARLAVLGTPVPVVEGVAITPQGAAHYAISSTGALVYVPGPVGSTANLQRSLAFSIAPARSNL